MKKPILKIKMIKVADLQPHPLLSMTGVMDALIARESRMAKKSGKEREKHQENAEILESRFTALSEDIQENGILEPLKICKNDEKGSMWNIADGRHRWMIARASGIKEVPCMIVSEVDARAVIHSALLGKPMSKGAIAYTVVKLYPEVCDSENGGDRKSDLVTNLKITQAELAKKSGVSSYSISKAVEIYRMLYNTGFIQDNVRLYVPRAKAKFEDSIYVPNIGLGGVKSGIVYFRDNGTNADDQEDGDTAVASSSKKKPIEVAKIQIHSATRMHLKRWETANPKMRDQLSEIWAMEIRQDESFCKALINKLTD